MPELYGRFLAQQVFKVEPNADGVYEKTLHCMFLGKAIGIPLALHPPNASRGSEWRIGRMNTFPPWKLDMVEFKQRTHEWFYVIVLDENGNVWGALARNGFADDVPSIRQFATKLLGLGRKQARGAVNLKTGAEVV